MMQSDEHKAPDSTNNNPNETRENLSASAEDPHESAPHKDETQPKVDKSKRPGEIKIDVGRAAATKTIEHGDREDEPKWGTARFTNQMMLELRIPNSQHRFSFTYDQLTNKIWIGRADPESGTLPDIDLAPHGGLEKGVSRRHAIIMRDEATISLVDNNSANGTFLNGLRLVGDDPRILRDSDEISVGEFDLRVNFRRAR